MSESCPIYDMIDLLHFEYVLLLIMFNRLFEKAFGGEDGAQKASVCIIIYIIIALSLPSFFVL